jgi:hypothetical protein
MIIEFLAPPGAGKSFYANSLSAYLRSSKNWSDYKVLSSHDLLTYKTNRSNWIFRKVKALVFYASAINLITIKLLFKVLRKYGMGRNGRNLCMYTLGIFARYVQANRLCATEKIVIIMDEGVSQIARLFWKDNELIENLPKYYYDLESSGILPSKDLLLTIFIKSTVEVNFTRIENRDSGWPRIFRNLSDKEKKILLSQFHNEISKIMIFLLKDSIVVEIDNSSAFNYNEETLKEQLEDISRIMGLGIR